MKDRYEWMEHRYNWLDLRYTSDIRVHEISVNLRDIRTVWQRLKFLWFIFNTLGGNKP